MLVVCVASALGARALKLSLATFAHLAPQLGGGAQTEVAKERYIANGERELIYSVLLARSKCWPAKCFIFLRNSYGCPSFAGRQRGRLFMNLNGCFRRRCCCCCCRYDCYCCSIWSRQEGERERAELKVEQTGDVFIPCCPEYCFFRLPLPAKLGPKLEAQSGSQHNWLRMELLPFRLSERGARQKERHSPSSNCLIIQIELLLD